MAVFTKYSDDVAKKICDVLRAGNTRKDACDHVGITEMTFWRWMKRNVNFVNLVTRAEADCAIHFAASIKKAGTGFERTETRTTKKVAYRESTIKHPDGRIEEVREPVPFTEVTTTVSNEFDWRAGLEWLKRRRRGEWGDSVNIELDSEIARFVDALAGSGEKETA